MLGGYPDKGKTKRYCRVEQKKNLKKKNWRRLVRNRLEEDVGGGEKIVLEPSYVRKSYMSDPN